MEVTRETPLGSVNVMRGGPSNGIPTKPSQSDIMQTRWGTHGAHPIIAVYPALAEELFSETIRAFNLSEKFWNPVIILMDEVIAKAREGVKPPANKEISIYRES